MQFFSLLDEPSWGDDIQLTDLIVLQGLELSECSLNGEEMFMILCFKLTCFKSCIIDAQSLNLKPEKEN